MVVYSEDGEEKFDIVCGLQVDIFDHYHDQNKQVRTSNGRTGRSTRSFGVTKQRIRERKKKVVKGDLNLTIDVDELHNKVRKEYKKIKKYMKSSIYNGGYDGW